MIRGYVLEMVYATVIHVIVMIDIQVILRLQTILVLYFALSYSFLFSIKIIASSIVNSVGSFSSGIVAFSDLYLI